MSRLYGLELERGIGAAIAEGYRAERDVIVDPETSPNGENVIVRIGRTVAGGGWEQIAHVVLTRAEAAELRNGLDVAAGG